MDNIFEPEIAEVNYSVFWPTAFIVGFFLFSILCVAFFIKAPLQKGDEHKKENWATFALNTLFPAAMGFLVCLVTYAIAHPVLYTIESNKVRDDFSAWLIDSGLESEQPSSLYYGSDNGTWARYNGEVVEVRSFRTGSFDDQNLRVEVFYRPIDTEGFIPLGESAENR